MLGKRISETHTGMFNVHDCKDLVVSLRFINPNVLSEGQE
jgi:hypothetical protein